MSAAVGEWVGVWFVPQVGTAEEAAVATPVLDDGHWVYSLRRAKLGI